MKKTILILSTIFFISCNKDAVISSAENNGSTIENILDAYDHDVLIYHSSHSYFATEGEMASLNLKAWENGPTSKEVDLGDFYFDNSKVQIDGKRSNYISESLDKNILNCLGKDVTVGFDGNKNLGFEPFTSNISIVKALKSDMAPKTTRVDLTKDFTVSWVSENKEDDLALYVIWYGDRKLQTPKRWLKMVKDNGTYSIPNSVIKDYNPRGKVKIQLIRFDYNSQKVGDKKILLLSTSTMDGLFKIATSN
jgi:hypothetical protein